MKRKIKLLFVAASSVFTMSAQVILQEEFTENFDLASTGWAAINLSAPTGTGTVGWTQGNQTGGNASFFAYNGFRNDFYCADFTALPANTAGGISAWLMTPTLIIYNGAVLQFATRTPVQTAANTVPDRLQVRMSANASTVIPTGTTSVGSFTNLVFEVNPGLTTSSVSAVTNGSVVNGYPQAWTVYSVQVSGVTGTVTGRFAFRYFVNNGGDQGSNSRMIGLDAVKYTLPCGPTVQSYTTCAGQPVTLTALGGLPATTYLWSNSANTSTNNTQAITVTAPASGMVVYTLSSSNGAISCGVIKTASVTVGSNLSINVTAAGSATNFCSGLTVTLSASSAASAYAWGTSGGTSLLGTAAVITVTPNTTTTYTVGGLSGVACTGNTLITVNVIPSPTLGFALTPTAICLGIPGMTVTASGASSYTYDLGGNNTYSVNPLMLSAASIPTASGTYNFNIYGTGANGCRSGGTAVFTVQPLPVISVVSSAPVMCVNSTATLTASGAVTYTWSGAGVTATTADKLAYTALSSGPGSGIMSRTISIVGTSSLGCVSKPAIVTQTAYLCTGVEDINGNVETSVFPNPFVNELNIAGLRGRVEIYNALGQLVISKMVEETASIDTSLLNRGVYIVKAYNNSGTEVRTTRLLKN